MGKKKDKVAKKARSAEKALKAQSKSASKAKKKASKFEDEEDQDQNIDDILAEYAREQTNYLAVKITLLGDGVKPKKRLNGSLISSFSNRKELLLFGGEGVNSLGMAEFYNDLLVYNTDSSSWREVTSPNTPLPRSGHNMCVHASTGIIVLFGGEFSSPKQNTFYHYGDTWLLDSNTKEWSKVESKKSPSPRSGHRMTSWKNYVLLHGGFRDLAASTTYLDDLWAFDVTTYKWQQIEFPPSTLKPEARSGHSFLPTEDGAVIWGGYSKVKNSQKKIVGKVHSDCWQLKLTPELKTVRWERRRKSAWAPSPRVGCSMVYHKGRGILFAGVYDTEETEESLESQFYNDLFAFQVTSNKWFPLSIRPPRKRPAQSQVDKNTAQKAKTNELAENLSRILGEEKTEKDAPVSESSDDDSDDEQESVSKVEHPVTLQLPHARFNASTTVLGDTLYIYGGIWEKGDKEFSLDSMYAIELGKLDGVKVIWENFKEEVDKAEAESGESDDEMDDEDEDEDEEEDDVDEDGDEQEEEENAEVENAPEEIVVDETEELAETAGGISIAPDPRPYLPHPRPFESLRAFYSRTGNSFMEWAISNNKDGSKRGKELKRDAFELAEERWWERYEEVRALEDQYEEAGGIGEIVEREESAKSGRARR
ncbi:hypothetical protein V1514DRAFT_308812 [Lipomyces japonicus]|uniref:uncharacterized protein n=1 Tax=Lipomyces japonicus TaxID=56871 RepID=UPI0034CFDAD8